MKYVSNKNNNLPTNKLINSCKCIINTYQVMTYEIYYAYVDVYGVYSAVKIHFRSNVSYKR